MLRPACVCSSRHSFNPMSATEFVEKLNHFVLQRAAVPA